MALALSFALEAHAAPKPNDFNGDGRSEMVIYDPPASNWYIRTLGSNVVAWQYRWGRCASRLVPGDYDGDGKGDLAVFDTTTGKWSVKSLDGRIILSDAQWGWGGAFTVAGDYDGDGKSDLAVYDVKTGNWYIRKVNGATLANPVQHGGSGMIPVSGDYDGDGKSDLAVFDARSGNWYIRRLGGKVIAWPVQWGWNETRPVAGDYDGDGTNDLAVFNNRTGNWYIRRLDGAVLANPINWGPGMKPVPGDYDGDGKYDLAVFDAGTGNWHVRRLGGKVLGSPTNWGWAGAHALGVGDVGSMPDPSKVLGVGFDRNASCVNPIEAAAALKSRGLNATSIGFFGDDAANMGNPEAYRDWLANWITVMRANNILTYVQLLGTGGPGWQYGLGHCTNNLTQAWFNRCLNVMKDIGTDLVLFTPVVEANGKEGAPSGCLYQSFRDWYNTTHTNWPGLKGWNYDAKPNMNQTWPADPKGILPGWIGVCHPTSWGDGYAGQLVLTDAPITPHIDSNEYPFSTVYPNELRNLATQCINAGKGFIYWGQWENPWCVPNYAACDALSTVAHDPYPGF